MRVNQVLVRILRDTRGGTAIEYGLIVSLIVIAMIGALRGLAGENTATWAYVAERVRAATPG